MASYSTLLIPILNEILVREIGEASIPPLKWDNISPNKYKFQIKINNQNEEVTVDFEAIQDESEKQYYLPPKYKDIRDVFNVAYQVQGTHIQYAKTDLKILLTILSTIVDIIKYYTKRYEPKVLYIRGTPKELDSDDITKKSNLYKAFIKKQIDKIPNYGIDTYRDGFIIIKTK